MVANWSLHHRLSVTLAIFGGVVSLALASIIYIASADLEARLIDDTLSAELDDFVARRQRNPQSIPERTATIRAYVINAKNDEDVPEAVKNLTLGRHQLTLDHNSYRAAVRHVGEQRFVVLYDTSSLQQRESGFLLLLSVSVFLVTLVSALAGRWLATRMIAPVNELARRVAELKPEDEPAPLAEEFPWLEVRRLAVDFDVYLQRLHDFIERERLFTGDVSHELRTPLAVIHGATELLLADKELNPKNQKRLMRIARATQSMEEITAALLALAREKGEASSHSSECDIESIAAETIEQHNSLFQHKNIDIILEIIKPSTQRVDHAIFSMILGNLLRNALNFSEQGDITLRINQNIIQIEDNGAGLGTGDTQHLFQPYVHGHHKNSGTGLGLSLVWRLCELSGWEITLNNRPTGGTLTQLQYPRKKTPQS